MFGNCKYSFICHAAVWSLLLETMLSETSSKRSPTTLFHHMRKETTYVATSRLTSCYVFVIFLSASDTYDSNIAFDNGDK